MAFLKIAKLGKPVLRKISKPVTESEYHTPEFQKFLDDMVETMRTLEAVGLSAPQVYRSKQVIVVEARNHFSHPESRDIPLLILLNPTITYMSEEKREGLEGCVSLDTLRGKVVRSLRVRVKGFDRKMRSVELEAEGFFARVLQHEIDHLNGKVFIDRVTDLNTLILRSTPVHPIPPDKVSLQRIESAQTIVIRGSGTGTVTMNDAALPEMRKVTEGKQAFREAVTVTYHSPMNPLSSQDPLTKTS